MRGISDDIPSGRLPAGVWALGFVSLFMDVSSEMIHALLPVFLTSVLGASAVMVGLIEGLGEATASFAKPFSGWLSDRLGRRKALIVIGYGLGALSKPFFALAPTAGWVLFARFSDRVGKGMRGAPRDALVGDLTPDVIRGAAYGLRQSLDTVGAFAGPLLAMGLMVLYAGDFRQVFWTALIPGALAVVILVIAVHEPRRASADRRARPPIRWRDIGALGGAFWAVLAVGTIIGLARFSEAFLILRAQSAGLQPAAVPLVLVVMNVVYAVSAYPAGALADRREPRQILAAGLAVLIAADLILALAPGIGPVLLGVGLWGLHMGLTQGLLAALVARHASQSLRGTAFGLFHLASGFAVLVASLLAGGLWDWGGPEATFLCGAGLSTLGLVAALATLRTPTSEPGPPSRGR